MGLFDFLKKKNTGIEDSKFNSQQFQNEIGALALWKLEENNGNPNMAIHELKKIGLNDAQVELVLSSARQFINKKQMVDNFQGQIDSGEISEIKIKPNPEHKKGNVDKEQVDKYIAFGAYQMDRNELDNALELFDKAIELDENATLAYANKGTLYTKKGDNEKALEFYNKALAIEPGHIQILENKMDLLFEMMNEKNEKEFIDTAKAILKNDPIHPNALIYIIQNDLKENDMENALKSAKKLFANFHTENISSQLLLETLQRFPTNRALDELSNLKNEISEDASYQLEYCKGLYLIGIQDYDKSIITFENLNKIQEFSWNYYQIAIIKNFQNKTEECLGLLKKTFELEPGLKEDAKQIPYFQNLSTNQKFMELIK